MLKIYDFVFIQLKCMRDLMRIFSQINFILSMYEFLQFYIYLYLLFQEQLYDWIFLSEKIRNFHILIVSEEF